MRSVKNISKYQFTVFRIVFGLYLLLHFIQLIPFGDEIFSNQGFLPDPRLNPTFGLFPNLLYWFDSPLSIQIFLIVMSLLSISFIVGFHRQATAFLLWFGWACLFNRNNLISNPGLPYVGLILLLTILIPSAEPVQLGKRKENTKWFFPAGVYWTAWLLMAIGYSFSGLVKLQSPSWMDGSAMVHLVTNPLARPGFMRDLFLSLPNWMTNLATWSTLAAEVLFLPLSFSRRTRLIAWVVMVSMHLGILTMVDFADLTMGMLMIHLFTFDPDWLPGKIKEKGKYLLLYDGVCGLCDNTVQFLLEEDKEEILLFAPLQGETAKKVIENNPEATSDMKSLIFVEYYRDDRETVYLQSEGVLRLLNVIGGFWRAVSWIRIIPRFIRDPIYNFIGANRYRWFGKYNECKIPTPEVKMRFLS